MNDPKLPVGLIAAAPIGGRDGPASHARASVSLRERRDLGLLHIRGRLDAAAFEQLAAALGTPLPTAFLACTPAPLRMLRVRLDHWCIVLPRDDLHGVLTALRHALGDMTALVVDASAAGAWLRIEGAAAAELLAAGCAIDFHPAAFPIGHACWTRLARLRALLMRDAVDAFDLRLDASYGRHAWDWLMHNVAMIDALHARRAAALSVNAGES